MPEVATVSINHRASPRAFFPNAAIQQSIIVNGVSLSNAHNMDNHLRHNLQVLSLGQYIDVMQEYGFVDWDTLSKAQEKDFDRLGLKLGHRRRLQRELASMRGLPIWAPLDRQYGDYEPPSQLHRQRPSTACNDADKINFQSNPV
ncbi:hypothetical protein ST47_g4740 [Ascochyta rabiei]|uniref:Uncharacterized protein n=1 Tax=Didymella rabiei TaxID=5454 RepID=A0A163F3L4_DIDRA|nr:hypothetical protein ST47_g4740 [Ascochyta rabiei]